MHFSELTTPFKILAIAGPFLGAAVSVLIILWLVRRIRQVQTQQMYPAERNGKITVCIWAIIVWIMVTIAFDVLWLTGLWKYAWLMYLFGTAAMPLIIGVQKLIEKDLRGIEWAAYGAVWMFTLEIYLEMSKGTNAWSVSWIVLVIGACLHLTVSGIAALLQKRPGKVFAVIRTAAGILLALAATVILAFLLMRRLVAFL